ncbi:MAG: hypothetical protein H0U77_00475 [Nocardioidaceae bacterium]|nr:hypothetical protein [Nocardioidaceae bacterium]
MTTVLLRRDGVSVLLDHSDPGLPAISHWGAQRHRLQPRAVGQPLDPRGGRALYAAVQVASSPYATPLPVRLPGLDPETPYAVTVVTGADTRPRLSQGPSWTHSGPPASVVRCRAGLGRAVAAYAADGVRGAAPGAGPMRAFR